MPTCGEARVLIKLVAVLRTRERNRVAGAERQVTRKCDVNPIDANRAAAIHIERRHNWLRSQGLSTVQAIEAELGLRNETRRK